MGRKQRNLGTSCPSIGCTLLPTISGILGVESRSVNVISRLPPLSDQAHFTLLTLTIGQRLKLDHEILKFLETYFNFQPRFVTLRVQFPWTPLGALTRAQ